MRFVRIYETRSGLWWFDGEHSEWRWEDDATSIRWFAEVCAWCESQWGPPSDGENAYGPIRNFWTTFNDRQIIRISKPEWAFELKMRYG
ncbi:MAG: hypothetical protein EOO77_29325 [Oxalobacteraceae bacterium]|nr:MAG: hypothetical protein EOO77_29325 [Oxalobacteraceae bacterium]